MRFRKRRVEERLPPECLSRRWSLIFTLGLVDNGFTRIILDAMLRTWKKAAGFICCMASLDKDTRKRGCNMESRDVGFHCSFTSS